MSAVGSTVAVSASDEAGRDRALLVAMRPVAPVVRRLEGGGCAPELVAELMAWGVYLRVVRGLREYSVRNYLVCVFDFLGWLSGQELELGEVTPPVVERWQKSLYMDRRLSAASRDQMLSAVRVWFAWRSEQAGRASPLVGMRGPRRERHVPRKFSSQQLAALFRSCDVETRIGKRDLAMLLLFYATGMRRYEMTGLKLDQLQLQERVGRVLIHGKGAKEREVTFEGPTLAVLQEWLYERDRIGAVDASVWLSMKPGCAGAGISEWGVELVLARAKRRAKIRAEGKAVHALRVTFATDLYDAGEDLERIRVLMGHESIETTRRYLAISDRQHKTRMPAKRIHDLLGTRNTGMPLWAKHRQEQWQKRD